VQFQKISLLLQQKGLEFPGGGVCKTKRIKEMTVYRISREVEGGGGVLEKSLLWERYGYFLE